MDLKTPLNQLSGVGPYIVYKLKRLNLNTVEDLIYHFPFRYDDFSQASTAKDAQVGERVTLVGEIWSIKNIYTRSRKILTQAIFNDGTIPITLTWFNQSWLTKQIKVGDRLQVSGKLTKYKNNFSIIAPVWERAEPTSDLQPQTSNLHTGRLVPVYPETEGLSSKWLRTQIYKLRSHMESGKLKDPLPDNVRNQMLPLYEALQKIHFPDSLEEALRARERLGFDELFYIMLATQKIRLEWQKKPSVEPLNTYPEKLAAFIDNLPFKLTSAQNRVIKEVAEDLTKTHPMNRLIQGEVGSGKTVVAAAVAYLVHLNKLKTLFMAPTEILAFQHFSTLTRLLGPFGIKVGIYTGSRKFNKLSVLSGQLSDIGQPVISPSDKPETGKQNSENRRQKTDKQYPDVIVGTHAILSEKLITPDVGLIIIDEQQRFGVEQRTYLRSKAKVPHFLTTTATPIPRTVALTLYGDLDVSIIDEMPEGRRKVKTFVVPNKKRQDAYEFIRKKVKTDDQVYIITPLIELSETLASVKAATVEYQRLQEKVFPDLKLGLLHGRLKSKEKEQVLNDFKDKKIDILISTSVVEVGVDVTNATIMVIESAERFGLSQLHQLRGRVGRGEKESFCLLFTEDGNPQSVSRLKNLERIDNGLKLAELDLKIRGSGEIFGTKQSGRFDFKLASFSDLDLIEKVRKASDKILGGNPSLDKYPSLVKKLEGITKQVMPD